MPTTIEVLKQARSQIVDNPSSYEFMDYCHCLAGHVFKAATGDKYTDELRCQLEVTPHSPVNPDSPFGQVIEAMLEANGRPVNRLSAGELSHLNSQLVETGEYDEDDTEREFRVAAVKALDNTIDHLKGATA
jgi:hypothetical protein